MTAGPGVPFAHTHFFTGQDSATSTYIAMAPTHPAPPGISKRDDYNPTRKPKGSLLRLLSPRAGTSSRAEVPSLTLHVADYGSLLIQTTDSSYDSSRPRLQHHSSSHNSASSTTDIQDDYIPPPSQMHEYELSGTLEIGMPLHLGKRRVKAIRIGMSGVTRLDMGKNRGWEEDEIFKRKIEIRGADEAGITLEPGTQLYVSP